MMGELRGGLCPPLLRRWTVIFDPSRTRNGECHLKGFGAGPACTKGHRLGSPIGCAIGDNKLSKASPHRTGSRGAEIDGVHNQ